VILTGGCSELISGQCAPGRVQSSVAVYDPARGTFTTGLPLTTPRAWHRAIMRDDGLVVIVGGIGSSGAALPPEIYDPDESRGSTLTGPAGNSVTLASGMVIALNDAVGAADRVLAWSGRDEAPQPITQLPSSRADSTLTVLEDGTVLVAGGLDSSNVLGGSVVVAPSGQVDAVPGFGARNHTATLLLDGTVLLAGGLDASRRANTSAFVFLRSTTGPFTTPSTLAFDGVSTLNPSRPGRVSIAGGALVIEAGSQPPRVIESFALVPGPSLAGPSATGFSVSFLAGITGDAEAAVLFGDPASSDYVAVLFGSGTAPRVWTVRPDRPGLPTVTERTDCDSLPVDPGELPSDGQAAFTLDLRAGTITLRSASRTLLSCTATSAAARGALALGARTRSTGGSARFDNVQLTR
jgi:hypothetical protein